MYQQQSLLMQSFHFGHIHKQQPNFNPSSYQKAIFKWIQNGNGSCVVSAVPGSGKTTTLVQGSSYLNPQLSSKFLAFNKHIVKELEMKLPGHIQPSTLHSLGLNSIKLAFGKTIKVNGNKYYRLVSQYLNNHQIKDANIYKLLLQLVQFTQLTLTNYFDLNQLKELCNYYTIPITNNWEFYQQALHWILEQGREQSWYSISFDDMVYLPNILDLPVETADFLFVDECQDLNQAQLSLVMKAYKPSTRGLFVGDVNQAIMGFSAADTSSIANIIYQTNSTQLPLSICYRCPQSHIELANKVYNVIEPAPNAIEGEITKITKEQIPDYVQGGDLIICRCFYPLVQVYFNLLRLGIPAQVRNQDIGKQLIDLLSTIFGEINNLPLTASVFKDYLNQWFEVKKSEMINQDASALSVAILEDKINTLIVIYQGNNCQSINDCINSIKLLCQVQKNHCVNLTTIHGSKGLEAQRVFILRPDLIPHPSAKQDWEREQEKNLFFVALTRAKQSLFFCT